jgi:hypothetical protein
VAARRLQTVLEDIASEMRCRFNERNTHQQFLELGGKIMGASWDEDISKHENENHGLRDTT